MNNYNINEYYQTNPKKKTNQLVQGKRTLTQKRSKIFINARLNGMIALCMVTTPQGQIKLKLQLNSK